MTAEVAQMEVRDILTNSNLKKDTVVAELSRLPYEGRPFTSRLDAENLISNLNAFYLKSNVDSSERAAAETAMRKLIGELEEDEDENVFDDRPKPVVAANDDKNIASAKGEVTQPKNNEQGKLKPDARIDILLNIAEHSVIPYSRFEAIEAVGRLVENKGATKEQFGVLGRLRDEGPGNVRGSAGDVLTKTSFHLHHPEFQAPKPGGKEKEHNHGD